ncbi:MAG: hypothetical protein JXB32_26195 [Deltaproteobacteria bacterium]|nr:hypothetical protein [Deltaproteobacteria bacterium]
MRGWLPGFVVAWLMAVGPACDSTPMPIPPSLDLALVTITETPEPVDACPGPCVLVAGQPGATEPGTRLVVHRLSATPIDLPTADARVADDAGAFTATLGGIGAGGYRAVLTSEDGTTVVDFAPDVSTVPPWPAVPYVVPVNVACLALHPSPVEFGRVPDGTAETRVVELTNGCATGMDVFMAEVPHVPPAPRGPAFDVLYRTTHLEPGASASVVVVFWPQDDERYDGALVVQMFASAPEDLVLVSVPVGGVSTPR